jgi:hypothetical protein
LPSRWKKPTEIGQKSLATGAGGAKAPPVLSQHSP